MWNFFWRCSLSKIAPLKRSTLDIFRFNYRKRRRQQVLILSNRQRMLFLFSNRAGVATNPPSGFLHYGLEMTLQVTANRQVSPYQRTPLTAKTPSASRVTQVSAGLSTKTRPVTRCVHSQTNGVILSPPSLTWSVVRILLYRGGLLACCCSCCCC